MYYRLNTSYTQMWDISDYVHIAFTTIDIAVSLSKYGNLVTDWAGLDTSYNALTIDSIEHLQCQTCDFLQVKPQSIFQSYYCINPFWNTWHDFICNCTFSPNDALNQKPQKKCMHLSVPGTCIWVSVALRFNFRNGFPYQITGAWRNAHKTQWFCSSNKRIITNCKTSHLN